MAQTTTSCSSAVIALLVAVSALAQPKVPPELGLFPVLPAWDVALDGVLAAPPAFAGDRAFLPLDDRIAAYDLEHGDPIWSADTASAWRPALGEGLVFVAGAEHLTALHQEDGDVAWRVPMAALGAPPVWDNGWLIVVDAAQTLLALRAVDGATIWKAELGGKVNGPPALAADRVYATLTDHRVVALDVATGTQVWARRLGGAPNEMLALDDRVYVGSDDNFFYCLNTRDGVVEWRWRTGGDVIGRPLVDDHRVYFVSKDNVARGLDRRSGAQRWKRALQGRPTRGPVRAGDVLLVSGLSPRAAALSMRDGTPAGEVIAAGELAAAPYVYHSHGLSGVVLVARDLAVGTRLLAFRRTIDPPMNTPLPVLPGEITITVPGSPADSTAAPGTQPAPALAPLPR